MTEIGLNKGRRNTLDAGDLRTKNLRINNPKTTNRKIDKDVKKTKKADKSNSGDNWGKYFVAEAAMELVGLSADLGIGYWISEGYNNERKEEEAAAELKAEQKELAADEELF